MTSNHTINSTTLYTSIIWHTITLYLRVKTENSHTIHTRLQMSLTLTLCFSVRNGFGTSYARSYKTKSTSISWGINYARLFESLLLSGECSDREVLWACRVLKSLSLSLSNVITLCVTNRILNDAILFVVRNFTLEYNFVLRCLAFVWFNLSSSATCTQLELNILINVHNFVSLIFNAFNLSLSDCMSLSFILFRSVSLCKTHAHARARARARTHTHTHTRTHACTHARTHAPPPPPHTHAQPHTLLPVLIS